ncbi:MAG: hypothetical protein ACRD17_03420 [Terriglobales bacterium]
MEQTGSISFESATSHTTWLHLNADIAVYNSKNGTCGCYCDPCCAYDNFSMSPATLLVEVNGTPVALVPFGCYCNGQQDILEANITATNTSTAIYVNGGLIGESPGTTTINVDFAPVAQGGVNCYGAYDTSECYSAPVTLSPPPPATVSPAVTLSCPAGVLVVGSGGGYVEVNPTNDECVWSAVPQESWLSVTNGFGTGQYGGFDFTAAPNSGGANLVGSIAVTGATVNVIIGGSSGTASITVRQTGPISKQAGIPGHYYTIWNDGSITVTIGGVKETVYYGNGLYDTTAAVAAQLAASLGQPGTLTTTALSGVSVILTSKLRGSGTHYSITHAYSYDASDFTAPAFEITQSGTSMTGGAN